MRLTGHVVEMKVEVYVVGVGLLDEHVAGLKLMLTENVLEVRLVLRVL